VLLSGVNLNQCNLEGTIFDGSLLDNAKLENITMSRSSSLKRTNCSGAVMTRAVLNDVDMQSGNFSDALMDHVQMYNANIQEAIFYGTDLSHSSMHKVSIYKTTMDFKTNLTGTKITVTAPNYNDLTVLKAHLDKNDNWNNGSYLNMINDINPKFSELKKTLTKELLESLATVTANNLIDTGSDETLWKHCIRKDKMYNSPWLTDFFSKKFTNLEIPFQV